MEKLGFCTNCRQWVVVKEKALPNHNNKEGEHCTNSRYSPWKIKYRVTDIDDAKELAKAIIKDNENCLNSRSGHSIACGDGASCAEERQRRAQALAEFLLEYSSFWTV